MQRATTSALLTLAALCAASTAHADARPRIGVLVIFDQLRSGDLDRLEPLFGPGGFGGLMGAGAARYDGAYSYAVTETGPGHATLATGANPSVHGIVSNNWIERGETVYCAEDPAGDVLGAATSTSKRGPAQLKAVTLGDAMKIETAGRARVVTISVKDRAAILSAGRGANLALWYDPALGRFTTSRVYGDALPPWAERMAVELPRRAFAEGTWSPLPFPEGFDSLMPEDDLPGEAPLEGWTRTFPHDLKTIGDEAHRRRAYRASPQSATDLFALADAAIDEEKLGQDVIPDLLVVSISATDYIGHHYGPDSKEQVDLLRRVHMDLRQFTAGLERRFGRRGFALVVTSDHGGTPTVESATRGGFSTARIPRPPILAAVAEALAAALPKDPKARTRLVKLYPPEMYLGLEGLTPEQQEAAIAAARSVVEQVPGIAATVRVDRPDEPRDPYFSLFAEGWYRGRSGAFAVRQEPRVTFQYEPDGLGTDHGTPYLYDRRVPIFVVGADVQRGRSAFSADPRDVAPTLAYLLRMPPPDQAQGKPLPAVGD